MLHHILVVIILTAIVAAICLSPAWIYGISLATKKDTTEEPTGDEIYPEILPREDSEYYQNREQKESALTELVAISQEMGLYDGENFYLNDDATGEYVETDAAGNAIAHRYYIDGQEVTKEGYQYARWVTGLYHPKNNILIAGKNLRSNN
jgi:hypothetical protein